MGKINSLLRQLTCIPIVAYRYLVRPVLRPCCRFEPSCSEYAISAITLSGIFKGTLLIGRRILRCHPWAKGGYDPVLPNHEKP